MSDRSILLGVTSSCSDIHDDRVFASIPFDRATLEHLQERARRFPRAKGVYPNLYETYEFHSLPRWYETGKTQEYDDQADREKLRRFSYDFELDDSESYDESRLAELDELENEEIKWLLVPADELPSEGNLRTECDQLVMAQRGVDSTRVELLWFCYVKHTDVELRTAEITSEDIDRWLSELGPADHHVEEVPQNWS